MPSETVSVPEIGCDGCEEIIEGAVSDLHGIDEVEADQGDGTVTVTGEEYELDAVIDTVERAGYEVAEPPTT